jgi:hypothetical protein
MTIKVVNATEWTNRQGSKYQALSVVISGPEKVVLNPQDQLKVVKDGLSLGIVRFLGFGHIRYLQKTDFPPIELCVASVTDVRTFIDAELTKI